MVNFDVVDFSERSSEEVISFFWRQCMCALYKQVVLSWLILNIILLQMQVYHGNLVFSPGYVQYVKSDNPIPLIVGAVVGGLVLIVIILVVFGVILHRRSSKALDKQADELELVEKKIQHSVEAGNNTFNTVIQENSLESIHARSPSTQFYFFFLEVCSIVK